MPDSSRTIATFRSQEGIDDVAAAVTKITDDGGRREIR